MNSITPMKSGHTIKIKKKKKKNIAKKAMNLQNRNTVLLLKEYKKSSKNRNGKKKQLKKQRKATHNGKLMKKPDLLTNLSTKKKSLHTDSRLSMKQKNMPDGLKMY